MACDCIEVMDMALGPKGRAVDARQIYDLDTGTPLGYVIPIKTTVVHRKRGRHAYDMLPVYCPICGVRYAQEGAD